MEPIRTEAIRAEKVVKTFGKITALAGVSLNVDWGETLGILGDNGAGKSTLIKILTGYHQPDSGQIYVDGTPVQLASVDEARALGIECVYQDLALVNGLSIYHNMFLNRELLRPGLLRLLDHREMRRLASAALAEIGVDVPSVELAVGALSGGQRQAIAVARAVYSKARILLLDEPLAAMGAREARLIIELIERLRARGDIAIVMIAHNYAQTLEICDRVVLMQHGEITFESTAAATSAAELLDIVRREYRTAHAG
jgi:ABC-type sugar transport system ATPase subunit